ncbi:MAG: hypothetical protein SH850_05410 [Planctomycetaceae bacterium]|nr:hypothetical protein [Planctomycetaceae bacterium]
MLRFPRYSASALFSVAVMCSSVAAGNEPVIETKAAPAVQAKAVDHLTKALAKRTELAFADTPLVDALQFLAKSQGLKVVLDDLALKTAGINRQAPVSVEVSGVTLQSALKVMLEPLGLVAVRQDDILKVTTIALAQQPQPAKDRDSAPVAEKKPRPVFLQAQSALAETITARVSQPSEAAFSDTSLSDAIDFLRDYHQIAIWIDKAALQDQGIDPSTPISLELKGMTLRSVLKLMLEPHALTAIVESEVLKITTDEKARKTVVTRVYPVSDLVESPEDLLSLQEAIRTATHRQWNADDEALPGTMSIVPRSKSLVVRQTYAVHDEIVELLTNLRAAQALSESATDN